jgi:KUP system potassium uptake protein
MSNSNTAVNRGNSGSSSTGKHALAGLSLAALGVVFGDIGTSPLYAIRECFHGAYGIDVTRDNILGVLSLMFWALMIIVSIKYVTFIFRADNRGEGGVIALTALVQRITATPSRRRSLLIALGIFAACLLYGDGVITPAISVLSAAEGLRIIAPSLQPYVIPLTIAILAALFMLQHRGTARVGSLFGPVMLVWFVTLAVLGFRQILYYPEVLTAVLPVYGIRFLMNSGFHGFTVLGAIFLVVTGAEALYADLGHFGRKPIRTVWFYLVLPALLLNYMGQGALLMYRPLEAHHPFYATVPSLAVVPMVVLATCATIIASQAVITGVYSLTRQAIQMGYLPRLKITHTSSRHFGQIYVPQVNWLVMAATLGLVLGFQSSSKLAAAYGVAVTSTMLIATMLFYVVARTRWNWNPVVAGVPTIIFLITDLSFFSANISKIFHGAWFPLVLGGMVMMIMTTWKRGREILSNQMRSLMVPFVSLKRRMSDESISRVRGNAVFLTGRTRSIPPALVHNMEHNRIVHAKVLLLNFSFLDIPRVPNSEKLRIVDLGGGFHEVVVSYGFMESPSVPKALVLAAGQGLEIPLDSASYYLGRVKLVVNGDSEMSRWRAHIFAYLSKNSYDASAYFEIPEDRVIEVGIRLTI